MAESKNQKELLKKLNSQVTKRAEQESESIGDVVNAVSKLGDTSTRDEIAVLAVRSFFIILILIIVGIPVYNAVISSNENFQNLALSLPDMLQQYGSILGPIVGFVIGYYFKSKE